jgi:secreted PhoX family phosphatase
VVTVPAGYSVTVMTRLGDPIAAGVAAYANNGTDANFAQRIGDHGDALYWYGLDAAGARDDTSSTRGVLVQNHENLNIQYLHPNGPTNAAAGPRPTDEALKEIEAHGVSVTEYRDAGNRQWELRPEQRFQPPDHPEHARSVQWPGARQRLSQDRRRDRRDHRHRHGQQLRQRPTGWGTVLTCEENWAGYFRRSGDDAARTARDLTSCAATA